MSNTTEKELITCNRCRHQWESAIASECPECASYNIEVGPGRDSQKINFRPGDWVRFKGLNHAGKSFLPFYGQLRSKANAAPGSVLIKDEPVGLIFNPDGTLYCHAYLGVLLQKAKPLETMKPETGKEKKE